MNMRDRVRSGIVNEIELLVYGVVCVCVCMLSAASGYEHE